MGLNTVVLLLNDFIEDIENNPEEFAKELMTAINSGKETITTTGRAKVMPSVHNSFKVIYEIQGNEIREVKAKK